MARRPVTDYVGTVTVDPADGGGSTITWASTFSAPGGPAGWFWRTFITAALTAYCTGLARHAPTRALHG